MNDEKITISMDDVNRATPVPGSTPPPFFTPAYTPPESEPTEKPKRTGLKIGIAIAVVAVLAVAGIGVAAAVIASQTRPVHEYRVEVVKQFNDQLSDRTSGLFSGLRNRIQSVDPAMTMTSAEITRCDVSTIDGSDSAGRKDRNIDTVELGVRAYWTRQGVDGHTDVEFTIDGQTRIVRNSKVVYSTPIVRSRGSSSSTSSDDGEDFVDAFLGGLVWGFLEALVESL